MAWWFYRERRGPEWKKGWREQALSSMSLPPLPLLAILAIVILFISINHYMTYKSELHHTIINFQILLFIIPVLLIFVVRSMSVNGRFVFHIPRPEHDSIHRAGSSPWGVAMLLVVLLVMISYQSSFHSQWFRPLWRSY